LAYERMLVITYTDDLIEQLELVANFFV
jgi:hypothetical protein